MSQQHERAIANAYSRHQEYEEKVWRTVTPGQRRHLSRLWTEFYMLCKQHDVDPWKYSEREGLQ